MLDKIQGTNTDAVNQSTTLDRINEIEAKSHYIDNDSKYFVDESQISDVAYEKYQRDVDIKRFSQILMETDEQEAIDMVIKKTFDGTISTDNDDFLSELLSNDDFLNAIFRED